MGSNIPSCSCGICKTCRNRAYLKVWRSQNPEKVRAQKRKSKKTKRGRELHNEQCRRRRARMLDSGRTDYVSQSSISDTEKQKKRARWNLSCHVRKGRIKRLPCEVCGQEKSEAHHSDYSRPLEVQWLCTAHHAERERRNESARIS